MESFIEVLNHPAIAFGKGHKAISWSLVMLTILINGVFEPILQHLCAENKPGIDGLKMLKVIGLGIVAYMLICLAFWIVCKGFGSKVSFIGHISAWGISYVPTAICAVVVAITEVFFYVFWNSTLWGMLLSIVFVGILIWKAILYFIYLKDFAKLSGWRFLGACLVMGVIILVMAAWNGYVGLKTPIL